MGFILPVLGEDQGLSPSLNARSTGVQLASPRHYVIAPDGNQPTRTQAGQVRKTPKIHTPINVSGYRLMRGTLAPFWKSPGIWDYFCIAHDMIC